MGDLRLVAVTDIHHGADQGSKLGSSALGLLDRVADAVAAERPAAVLELGDRISEVDPATDRRLQGEVAERLSAFRAPVLSVCGNHDLVHLSAEENGALLSQRMDHRLVDLDGWRIILWRAEAKLPATGGFRLAEGDLAWLEAAIAGSDRPMVLVSHVPLSGQAMWGNLYFERCPERAAYREQAAIRAVLAKANRPLVAVAGHVHWNSLALVDGIPHLSLQSLTESFTTDGAPAGAWARLRLGATIRLEVVGRDPLAVELEAARTTCRWLPPQSSTGAPVAPQEAAVGRGHR